MSTSSVVIDRSSVVVDRRVLSNGITVLVEQDMRFRSTSIALYLVCGLADETEETVGVTHLLEHLLFRKTQRKTNRDISLWIDEVGGDINAFTDPLSLCLHASVPATRSLEVVDLFAELLLEADPQEDDLQLECEVIRQEILEADDDPDDLVYQNFNRAYWKHSMLRYPVFGSVDILQRFTLPQVLARLTSILEGARIVVGAVGNIDPDELVERIERHFGSLPIGKRPALGLGEAGSGLVVADRPGEQVHCIFGMPWPAIGSQDHLPGQLFSVLFGAGVSSRLFQLLREQRGLVYDTGSEIDGYPGGAVFQISAVVERANLLTVLELVVGELHKVRKDHFTVAELDRAKRMVLAQLEMESDTLGARLWRAVEGEVFLGRYQSVAESIAKLQSVQIESLSQMADHWLKPEHAVVSLVGDLDGADLTNLGLASTGLSAQSDALSKK